MKITLNEAGKGDCILIQSDTTNILIDGGTAKSFDEWYPKIKELKRLDAIFITHIDDDHTNGIIKFLEKNEKEEEPIKIEHIFFNGFEQLFDLTYEKEEESNYKFDALISTFNKLKSEGQKIGFSEGTSLSYLLNSEKYSHLINNELIHNETYDESLVIGDIIIEFIGPTLQTLNELKGKWSNILIQKQIYKKILTYKHARAFETYINSLNDSICSSKLISSEFNQTIDEYADSKYTSDHSLANKSSFAFLVKNNEKSILMLGDSHIETIIEYISKKSIQRLTVDAVKVSHHGSKSNIKKEFFEKLYCNKYLISTNGKKHGHPDFETLARIAKFSRKENTKIYINNIIDKIDDKVIEEFLYYKNKTNILMNEREVEL